MEKRLPRKTVVKAKKLKKSPVRWADEVYGPDTEIELKGDELLINGAVVPADKLLDVLSRIANFKASGWDERDAAAEVGSLAVSGGFLEYIRADYGHRIYLNGKLQSLNGCAGWTDAETKTLVHYQGGKIHRADGPAWINPKTRRYFLEDNELGLVDYILQTPAAEITTKIRESGRKYRIHRWREGKEKWLVVECADGTVALLSHTAAPPTADNFILEVLAEPLVGYTVNNYLKLGPIGQNLYKTISNAGPGWECWFDAGGGVIEYADDYTEMRICTERARKELWLQTDAFEGERQQFSWSLDYDRGLPTIPEFWVSRDAEGRPHSLVGPAIKVPGGKELFYCFGQQISKGRFADKLVSADGNEITWTDEQNQLHSDTSYNPSSIRRDGRVQYHLHGKLHNAHRSAVVLKGDGFVSHQYWLYGNQVDAMEFGKYDPKTGISEYLNEAGRLHRDGDFPAKYTYCSNGVVCEYYKDGKRHRDRGPAVICYVNESSKRFTRQEFWLNDVNYGSLEEGLARLERDKLQETGGQEATPNVKAKGAVMTEAKPETRGGQILDGFKGGARKGALESVNKKVGNFVSGIIPGGDKKAVQALVQSSTLLGIAEVVDKLPAGVADKVGFNLDRRSGFSHLARHLVGEMLGRNAVELAQDMAPHFAQVLSKMTESQIANEPTTAPAEEQKEEEQPATVAANE